MSRCHPRAEVWRYDAPGDRDHGTWAFQIIDRPWTEPMPNSRDSHILDAPASDIAYPTQAAALDAALRALPACRSRDDT